MMSYGEVEAERRGTADPCEDVAGDEAGPNLTGCDLDPVDFDQIELSTRAGDPDPPADEALGAPCGEAAHIETPGPAIDDVEN